MTLSCSEGSPHGPTSVVFAVSTYGGSLSVSTKIIHLCGTGVLSLLFDYRVKIIHLLSAQVFLCCIELSQCPILHSLYQYPNIVKVDINFPMRMVLGVCLDYEKKKNGINCIKPSAFLPIITDNTSFTYSRIPQPSESNSRGPIKYVSN